LISIIWILDIHYDISIIVFANKHIFCILNALLNYFDKLYATKVINASKPIPGNKEVRKMCQLDLDSDLDSEVNIIDVTHVLNTEYWDATESLVDECKPEKRASLVGSASHEGRMTLILKEFLS
jgi:hypothetical protein